MASRSPRVQITLVQHASTAKVDLVRVGHFKGDVLQAWRVGLDTRDHMMIPAGEKPVEVHERPHAVGDRKAESFFQ